MSLSTFRVTFPGNPVPPVEFAPTEDQSVLEQALVYLNRPLRKNGEPLWPFVPPGTGVEPPLPSELQVDHVHTRYYSAPPEAKSLAQCRSHGDDHAAYGWSPQVDPRWTATQIEAYWEGYRARKERT